MSYSSTTLIGNLGQDPETKTLDSGQTVTRMSIATTYKWRDREGNKQEETEWHNVVIWGKLGVDVAQRYLTKGDKVHIVGRLKSRKYEDKKYWDVVASEMTMLGGKRDGGSRYPSEEHAPPMVAEKKATAAATAPAAGDEALPF